MYTTYVVQSTQHMLYNLHNAVTSNIYNVVYNIYDKVNLARSLNPYKTLGCWFIEPSRLQPYNIVKTISLYYTGLLCTLLEYTTPHLITLQHCTTRLHPHKLHCTTQHYPRLHYTPTTLLHYITPLHYTSLPGHPG